MKKDIERHEECLKNRLNSLSKKRDELIRMEKEIEELDQENARYAAQIDLAKKERLVMCRCGVNPETEPHSCPYADEVNGNDDPEFCTCCADCRHKCAMDR